MWVQYNGVDLEVERVIGWSDRPVYTPDNMERLYRHVSLVVQCVVHPQATTLVEQGAMNSAPQIAADLKRRLLEPRRELRVKVGNWELLRSPQRRQKAGMPSATSGIDGQQVHLCDARGGPHPLYVDVVSIHGIKTMLATFAVETWLVDSEAQELSPRQQPLPAAFSALISHRWEQSTDLDEFYFSTRVTTGTAVFRADFLYEFDEATGGLRQITRKPSDYVAELNHPLPKNYRREKVRTAISSDGLTLNYSIVDVEQPSTVSERWSVGRLSGSWTGGVSQTADSLTMVPPFPRYFSSLAITAVGRRGATTSGLVAAAIRAAATFDPGATLKQRMYYQSQVTVSVGGGPRTVNLNIGYSVGGPVVALADNFILQARHAVEAQIDHLQNWPEDLRDDLGAPIRRETAGQQPYLGMLGHLLNQNFSGAQQRLNSQQVLDGQYVPRLAPESTKAASNLTEESSDAQDARGDGQRDLE